MFKAERRQRKMDYRRAQFVFQDLSFDEIGLRAGKLKMSGTE